MEILNIGALELLFIILLAFIILGPKKAVEIAGQVGRWVRNLIKSPFWRDIVSTSKDIRDIPRKMMDDAEIQKTIDEIERTTREVNANLKKSPMEEEESPATGEPSYPGEYHIHPDNIDRED